MERRVKVIEETLTNYAGPIARYVIKKAMKDLKLDDDVPPHMISKFLDVVIERAIFDPTKHALVKKDIVTELRKKKLI